MKYIAFVVIFAIIYVPVRALVGCVADRLFPAKEDDHADN